MVASLVEVEIEVGVDDFLHLFSVFEVVDVLLLEAQLEILVVIDADMCVGIVKEGLNHSRRVHQIRIEEFRQVCGILEHLGIMGEFFQGFHLKLVSTLHSAI